MALIDLHWHPTPRELRVFSVLQLVFFSLVAWVLFRRTGSASIACALLVVSLVGLIVGLIAPRFMRPVFVGWMVAAFPIGWVVLHLVLAAMFYLLLTPIGLTLRLLGRDPMTRRWDRESGTYWTRRRRTDSPRRYFQQF